MSLSDKFFHLKIKTSLKYYTYLVQKMSILISACFMVLIKYILFSLRTNVSCESFNWKCEKCFFFFDPVKNRFLSFYTYYGSLNIQMRSTQSVCFYSSIILRPRVDNNVTSRRLGKCAGVRCAVRSARNVMGIPTMWIMCDYTFTQRKCSKSPL